MSKIKKFGFTSEDFLSGRFDSEFQDAVQGINIYSDSASEYTPIRPSSKWASEYDKIVKGFPQISFILSAWQSNVGANSFTINIPVNDNNKPDTLTRKKAAQNRIQNIIYDKHNFLKIKGEIIAKIVKEGNAVLMINKDGLLIVESINRFNVFWDNQNKVARYSYLVDGTEKAGMGNLEHGVDLWHIKDTIFSDYPVAPSRLQVAMAMILLENKATRMNTHMFANGWLSNIFLKFYQEGSEDIMNAISDPTKDKENKTWKDRIMDIFNSKSRGVENAGKVGIIPFLEDIIKVTVSNKDSQYLEMMKQLTPERVAWAYSMTMSNFGTGGNLTENNASTFDDALYDKVGRHLEQALDSMINKWLLPLEGIYTSETIGHKFNEPEDPKKLLEVKEWREDWKNDAITLNEYRDRRNLAPLAGGDITYSQWLNDLKPLPDPNIVDIQATKKNNSAFFTKAVEMAAKKQTPTEKAVKTEEYTKFQTRWANAISKQLKAFIKEFSEVKDSDLENFVVKLPKIETFYAFNVLKKDLLQFAGMGLDEVKKDKRVKFKAEFFDGEYPQSILDSIEARTEWLLKGDGTYKGVDEATSQQIATLIKDNASLGVLEILKKLEELVPKMSPVKAEMIAYTEVAEAVEGSREKMYLENFQGGTKEWMTGVNDVCDLCRGNEAEGRISISSNHASGNSRPTAHPKCGCTELYYPE
jgi:phage portal protein BeeE